MVDSVVQKKMLVAFDAFQDYQSILDIAALLALHQQAELSALFVEDINLLLRMAGLPFCCEIDRISSVERPVDRLKITRSLEKQVQQIRRRLAEVKEKSNLQVTLTIVRGHYLAEALAAAEDSDLLLLDKRRKRNQNLFVRPGHNEPGFKAPVWVVFDGSEVGRRALVLTRELLKTQANELNIVLKVKNREQVAELERQARELTDTFHVTRHFFVEQKNDLSSVLQYILRHGCSIIVMNVNPEDATRSSLEASIVSERAECPVLLVA